MQDLSLERLAAVPHIVFGIFNLSLPNLLFWLAVIVVFLLGCWVRIPKFMAHGASTVDRSETP